MESSVRMVDSKAEMGALARLWLSVATTEHATEDPIMQHPVSPRARILVVDDDEAVGTSLRRALARHHDVVVLASARAALALVVAGERFAVILADLMMPEMTGVQMYEELERMAPDQARRVVFLSGGAFTTAARELLARVPNFQVEKPTTTAGLLTVIAQIVSEDDAHHVQ